MSSATPGAGPTTTSTASPAKPSPIPTPAALTAAVTTYTYDVASRLTKVTDALGNDTDYTYNNRNFVTQIQRPDPDGAGSLGRPTSTYDTTRWARYRGRRRRSSDQPVTIPTTMPAGSPASPARFFITGPLTYDNLGRVTKRTDVGTGGDYRYVKQTYNSRSWVTSTILSVPATGTLVDGPTTTFTYDAAGQIASATDPRGHTTALGYNDAGRQTKITLPDPDGASAGLVSPVIQFGLRQHW